MNPSQIFHNINAQFLLGNYHRVLDNFYKCQNNDFEDIEDQIFSIVSRSFIIKNRNQPTDLKLCQKIMNLVNQATPYFQGQFDLENNLQNDHLSLIYDQYQHKSVKSNDQEMYINLSSLLIQTLDAIRQKNISLAEKKVHQMQSVNDEDVATQLASINLQIYNHNFSEAIGQIENLKEMYQDSLKLINLRIICLMVTRIIKGQKKFQEAQQLCYRLMNISQGKFKDEQEMLICQNNLRIVNNCLGDVTPINSEFQDIIFEKLNYEGNQLFELAVQSM